MKLVLQNLRLSFPDLWTAKQYNGEGPFNYGATFLLPKNDKQVAAVLKAMSDAAAEKWGAKAAPNLAAARANPQRCFMVDGETKAYDGYAGHWALTAKRAQDKGPPLVLDLNRAPITSANGRVYAGCFVNCSIDVWAQDNSFGKGIRATLLGVQFAGDGAGFAAGAPPSEDDFADLSVAGGDDLAG